MPPRSGPSRRPAAGVDRESALSLWPYGPAPQFSPEVGPMSADQSSEQRDPVERLAEEFVARHRRGECPSPVEYAERHPQWAERIHALFPALLLMEHHKPGASAPGLAPGDDAAPAAPLERLGVFRIIRELGRGGMAI